MSRACFFLILFVIASFAAAQTTRPALSMSVAPTGVITLKLGDKTVADGHWQFMPPITSPGPGEMDAGKIDSTSVSVDSPAHAVVVDKYPDVKATYDLSLNEEDLHIAMHIENLDKTRPLAFVDFSGLVFHFSRVPNGSIHAWNNNYILAYGPSLFHPSSQSPLGVSFAYDDDFGFSAYSESEFDQISLFNAMWHNLQEIPSECDPSFMTTHHLAPSSSLDVDVNFTVSADRRITHLIDSYKKVYDRHFPKLFYKPDNRAVAQFAYVDKSYVTRGNPLGFGGAFRRLDSDAGTRAYIRAIAPAMQRADMLGIIFWSPGGYIPPMYPPDFDVFPESVQKNIPTLVDGFKKYGLRVGLCARCGDGVTREPGKEPVVYRLSADNADQMKTLLGRFHHAMDMGFDIFYLDSFGGYNPNDLEILKKVRNAVGPNVPLYTEVSTDTSLPYAGHYCEWQANGLGIAPEWYIALRYLCPESTWLCIDRTKRHRIPDYIKLGLTPLVGDQDAIRLPASRPATMP